MLFLKLPPAGQKRCESQLVVGIRVCECELFFFLMKEVLVDYLLPAAETASCSSQQWEKEAGKGRAGGRLGCSRRRQKPPVLGKSLKRWSFIITTMHILVWWFL